MRANDDNVRKGEIREKEKKKGKKKLRSKDGAINEACPCCPYGTVRTWCL
jgi:hypothetical protein